MRLLLIEDDPLLSELIATGLSQAGFESDRAENGEDALTMARTQDYDLVITDLGLPDMDGMTVLKKLRDHNRNIPVLVLTARDGLEDRVKGLNLGADDFVLKPFAMEELIARIRALLRRPSRALDNILIFGNLSLDTIERSAKVGDTPLRLTRRETDLLEQMMRNAGKIVSKESIESRLYSYGEEGSANSVEVLVHRLRGKLAKSGASVEIGTLRGLGYILAERS